MSLEADPRKPPEVRGGEAMANVSVGWDGSEDIHAAQRWLRLCLPENGALDAHIERAANQLLARRINVVPRLPETVLWGNADSEYPGAVSMSGDGALPGSASPVPLARYLRVSDADMRVLLANAVHEAMRGTARGTWGDGTSRARLPTTGRPANSGQPDAISARTRPRGGVSAGFAAIATIPRASSIRRDSVSTTSPTRYGAGVRASRPSRRAGARAGDAPPSCRAARRVDPDLPHGRHPSLRTHARTGTHAGRPTRGADARRRPRGGSVPESPTQLHADRSESALG